MLDKVPSHRLDADEIGIVKAMLKRGDRQHDIAAFFGINAGRIAEIAKGRRGEGIQPARGDLPPAGPYPAGREAIAAKKALREVLRTAELALERIEDWERRRAR